jgi:hypothetical protein
VLLAEYSDIFELDCSDLGHCALVQHQIDTDE